MRSVKIKSVVSQNKQLSLTVPPEIPSGPVEVLILAEDDADTRQAALLEFLDSLRSEPGPSRSAEAIEATAIAERDAWDG